MGLVYADVELINSEDMGLARRYIIGEEDVKRINVNILVDTKGLIHIIKPFFIFQ